MPDGMHLDNATLGPAGLSMEYRMIERRRSMWPDVGARVIDRMGSIEHQLSVIEDSVYSAQAQITALALAVSDLRLHLDSEMAKAGAHRELLDSGLQFYIMERTREHRELAEQARANVWRDFWRSLWLWLTAKTRGNP